MGAAQAGDTVTRANRGEITLQINLHSRQLAGHIAIAGRPAGQFEGWLELLNALDQALQTLDETRPTNDPVASNPYQEGADANHQIEA